MQSTSDLELGVEVADIPFQSGESALIAVFEVEYGADELLGLLEAIRDRGLQAAHAGDNGQKRSMHVVNFAVEVVKFTVEAVDSVV